MTLEAFRPIPAPSWPAQTWKELTGDAGRAASLLESDLARGCYLLCLPGQERRLLDCFAETLHLLNPDSQTPLRPWQYTFTNFLQAEDAPSDFLWRGCQDNTPASDQAARRGARLLPLASLQVPDNALAQLARQGPATPPAAPQGALPAPGPPAGRRLGPRPVVVLSAADLAGNVAANHRPWFGFSSRPVWLNGAALKGIGIALALLTALLLLKFLWR
jgi:hypothetical protein